MSGEYLITSYRSFGYVYQCRNAGYEEEGTRGRGHDAYRDAAQLSRFTNQNLFKTAGSSEIILNEFDESEN